MLIGVSFWLSFLISIKIIFVILIPAIGIYTIFVNKNKNLASVYKDIAYLSSFLLPLGASILFYNYIRYESIFETGYGKESTMFSFDYFVRDFFPYVFSLERGLLIYNPLLCISFASIFCIPNKQKSFFILVYAVISIWYLTMCFWQSWHGDYSWGNRFLVPILPLLFLSFAFTAFQRTFTKIVILLLGICSLLIQFSASFTKVHEINQIQQFIRKDNQSHEANQVLTGINLFHHKFHSPVPKYSLNSFSLDSSKIIDLSDYNTFKGFNIWSSQLLNYFNCKTLSYYTGLLIVFSFLVMIIYLFRIKLSVK